MTFKDWGNKDITFDKLDFHSLIYIYGLWGKHDINSSRL